MRIMVQTETALEYPFLLNGEWRKSKSAHKIDVIGANQVTVGAVQAMTREEIDEAAASAEVAQKLWEKEALDARASLLYAWADELIHRKEDIAETIMHEVGK